MNSAEYHVASYIVRSRSDVLEVLTAKINAVEGLEVHRSDEQSKLVVTAESNSHKGIAKLADKIYEFNEVVDVSAVYHEYMKENERVPVGDIL